MAPDGTDRDLLARMQEDFRDARLLEWAYADEALPAHVADAFLICVQRIEDAGRAIEHREMASAVVAREEEKRGASLPTGSRPPGQRPALCRREGQVSELPALEGKGTR